MKYVECIVAGAGPAGAYASLVLARAGIEVLCLEKHEMPRPKTCGGGLTMRGAKLLEGMDYGRFSLFTSKSIVFGERPGNFYRVASGLPLGHMIRREEFDRWLSREAAKEGAQLKEKEPLLWAEYGGGVFTVTTGAGTYKCGCLIGAEGAFSPTRRIFYPEMDVLRAFGVECSVPIDLLGKLRVKEQMFVFGEGWPGYAWVFPRGEEASVGVYEVQPGGRETLAKLKRFLASAGHPDPDRLSFRGRPIPYDGLRYVQKPIPCMLAGDAGGFADFATGEGLSYALVSGKIAAEAVVEKRRRGRFDPARTHRKYRRALIRGLRIGEKLGKAIYSRKNHFFGLVASRFFAGIMLAAAVNGDCYAEMVRNIPGYFLRGDMRGGNIERIPDPLG